MANIPPEFWQVCGFVLFLEGFVLFLKAVEAYFNMSQRIRTERIDLTTRQAKHRADQREAELREERAARGLEGLRRESPPFRLVDGELLREVSTDGDG